MNFFLGSESKLSVLKEVKHNKCLLKYFNHAHQSFLKRMIVPNCFLCFTNLVMFSTGSRFYFANASVKNITDKLKEVQLVTKKENYSWIDNKSESVIENYPEKGPVRQDADESKRVCTKTSTLPTRLFDQRYCNQFYPKLNNIQTYKTPPSWSLWIYNILGWKLPRQKIPINIKDILPIDKTNEKNNLNVPVISKQLSIRCRLALEKPFDINNRRESENIKKSVCRQPVGKEIMIDGGNGQHETRQVSEDSTFSLLSKYAKTKSLQKSDDSSVLNDTHSSVRDTKMNVDKSENIIKTFSELLKKDKSAAKGVVQKTGIKNSVIPSLQTKPTSLMPKNKNPGKNVLVNLSTRKVNYKVKDPFDRPRALKYKYFKKTSDTPIDFPHDWDNVAFKYRDHCQRKPGEEIEE